MRHSKRYHKKVCRIFTFKKDVFKRTKLNRLKWLHKGSRRNDVSFPIIRFRLPKYFLQIKKFASDNIFRFKSLNQGRHNGVGWWVATSFILRSEVMTETPPPYFELVEEKMNELFSITRAYLIWEDHGTTLGNYVSFLITLLLKKQTYIMFSELWENHW